MLQHFARLLARVPARVSLAPKARCSSAWGNAPRKAVDTKPSAEGAIQSSVETRFQRSFTMQYGAPGALPQVVMSRRFQRQTYPLVVR
jgi:hypothetical protein